MTIGSFPAKAAASHLVLAFDFSRALGAGETLINIVEIAITVNSGTDPNPYAILSPTAIAGIQDKFVVVPVVETRAGYKITVTVDTSNPQKRLSLSALLPLLVE